MSFFESLGDRIESVDSLVSVGLDPDPDRLPSAVRDADLPRWAFNRRIIDATHEYAAAYKPNAAFYEDPDGWRALRETVAYAHGKDVPVLLDAKRADIGNTARQYADLLEWVDAITVNPYLGGDSLQPFLSKPEKGVFVLCRTSNDNDTNKIRQCAGAPIILFCNRSCLSGGINRLNRRHKNISWLDGQDSSVLSLDMKIRYRRTHL